MKVICHQYSSPALHISNVVDISHRVSAQKSIFESFFCCSKNHLPKACVHDFIGYCPSYCRAFTTKLMGLPEAKLEARKERSSLQPKHLDRQYLQDKQVLLDHFRKNRSTNWGTKFGIDFCFSLFSYKVTCFSQRVWVWCQLLLKLNVAVTNSKAKTTLVTARISLFHRLWCVVMLKARLLWYHGKNSKNKYLKNLKIWNMGP